jgi:uncharacterized protein
VSALGELYQHQSFYTAPSPAYWVGWILGSNNPDGLIDGRCYRQRMAQELSGHPNAEMLRNGYRAYAESDMATLSALYSPDVVFHVSGRHPLSGDYLGLDSAFGYMLKVGEITGGRGVFEVETVLADDDTVVAVVMGIAWSKDTEFRRRIIHVNRIENGQVREFWDLPYDQHAEDEFWTKAVE